MPSDSYQFQFVSEGFHWIVPSIFGHGLLVTLPQFQPDPVPRIQAMVRNPHQLLTPPNQYARATSVYYISDGGTINRLAQGGRHRFQRELRLGHG
jgi:hypothetical protein